VDQHIAGEVEICVMYTKKIFLQINWWKNFENWSVSLLKLLPNSKMHTT